MYTVLMYNEIKLDEEERFEVFWINVESLRPVLDKLVSGWSECRSDSVVLLLVRLFQYFN